MNIIGSRLVALSSLKLPGDMRVREQTARVQALAETMGEVGQLQEPLVRFVPMADRHGADDSGNMRVIAGRDRIAAHMLRNETKVMVKLIECTNEEARRIELIENAHRRHDKTEQSEALKELQRILQVAEEQLIEQMSRQPTRREVHAAAAPVLGVLPETVARKEQALKAATTKRKRSGLETWGLELDESWHTDLSKLELAMEALAGAVTKALAASAFLQDNKLVTPAFAANVRQELSALSRIIRDAQPVALCPYCKGQEELQDKCAGCVGTGWVGAPKLRAAPEPLKDSTALKVARDGKLAPMETLAEEPMNYEAYLASQMPSTMDQPGGFGAPDGDGEWF